MVKIKRGELPNIMNGLTLLSNVKIPVKSAYWISKLARKIESEYRVFQKRNIELVKKYADLDKDGKPVFSEDKKLKFNNGNEELYNNGYKELADNDIEIEFDPIPLNMLGDEQIEYPALVALDKFIVEERLIETPRPRLIRKN